MNDILRSHDRTGLLLLGLSLALGMIATAFVVTTTLERLKRSNETITVKGFAERRVTSDIAVWKGQVTARGEDLRACYETLSKDMERARGYLLQNGLEPGQIELSSVNTMTQYRQNEKGYQTHEIAGYILEQSLSVNSPDVRKVAQLSKDATSLISEGIVFTSFPPEFYTSEFDRIKIDLLGEATSNARLRAEQFAGSSGIHVGDLKSASQGVFQVTPVHSTEISSYGMYDTSSIEKSVKAVVTIQYAIKR